jgi:tetratricopeptide (TPR) repeat protein
MTQEPNPNNQKIIKLEGIANDESKLTQIGSIETQNVHLTTQQVQFLVHPESSTKQESARVLHEDLYQKPANWQGRKEEIKHLKQWLNNPNIFLIGIEGIGGIGKSMLAAYIYENEKIEGVRKPFWADVSNGKKVFSDLATQVLQEFNFRVPDKEAQLAEALVKCLQSGEYLLIIDNLESLLQTNGLWASQFYEDFFTRWVDCGGKSKVIVTTRERPESPTIWKWLPLEGLKVEEGVALLTALGIQGNLEEFVKLVDGYPLLLRFVAGLLNVEYPQDPNLKRLKSLGLGNLQQLLTDPKVDGRHRQQKVAMEWVLDTSLQRLSELQKSLLQNISVFRGAVNGKAAVAVCLGSSETEIERELRNLVKRSFLSEKLIDDCRWFEFQPVVLEYLRYKAGNQIEANQRAINYYLLKIKQKPWKTKEDIKEYLEIFYHWFQLEQYDSAFDILNLCNDFLSLRGYYTDQVELWGQLVEAWEKKRKIENWNYRVALTSLGNAYYLLGQYQQAIKFLQQSLDIAREIGNQNEQAAPLCNLANVYYSLGRYQQAIEFLQQSLDIAREIGDRHGEAICLGNLGNTYGLIGQYQQAIEFHHQSLDIAREIGNRQQEAGPLAGLGLAYQSLGQYQQAIKFHHQSLDIAKEIGNRNGEAKSLGNLGIAYESLGQYQQAIEFHHQSLDIAKEIGDRDWQAKSLGNLGNTYKSLGQYQQAIEFHHQSLDIAREIGNIGWEGSSLNNLGNTYQSLEQYQQAIEFYQESLDLARKIGDRNMESASLCNLGVIYCRYLGKYPQALEFLHQSLDIAREIGNRACEGSSFNSLGATYGLMGQYQQAIEFHQQSLHIAREIGDRNSEAKAWFNLGETLQNLNREPDALGAYRNARELFQIMGLDANVQDCNNNIDRLSQPKMPVVFHRGFWGWLRQLWRRLHGWFRR